MRMAPVAPFPLIGLQCAHAPTPHALGRKPRLQVGLPHFEREEMPFK